MRLLLPAASLLTACTTPVWAQEDERPWAEIQEIFDRGCGDDRGVDRCDLGTHAKMHELYGIESPQAMLDGDATMRRAMIVNGYGQDIVAVTFSRRPGNPPTIEISAPRAELRPPAQPLTAAISSSVWDEVLSRSSHFDKPLASELPKSGASEKPTSICLHGWFSVVEAVDAPRPSPNTMASTISDDGAARQPARSPRLPGRVSVKAQGACSDGLAIAYAWELVRIAHDNLPECSTLSLSNFRNESELLASCSLMRGDRLAAGEAKGLQDELSDWALYNRDQEISHLFAGLLDDEERAEAFKRDVAGAFVMLLEPEAKGPHEVIIEGHLAYMESEDDDTVEVAPMTLFLTRQMDVFKIERWQIGERRLFEPN